MKRANGRTFSEHSAKAAGLRYVCDADRGIRRVKAGRGFRYVHPDGRATHDRATLGRIRALAIPPAWRAVWICPRDDGHLQATGRDARGRKQYRYDHRWQAVRNETKYGRMAAFAKALPAIRRRVRRDLALPGLARDKVLATVVRLLETTRMRVGNEEYARQNDSFGLTTLRAGQVRVRGARLRFKFRGKSGVRHEIELTDAGLARIVRRMHDLPGEELFRYVDEGGITRRIESADVNAYLKRITGEEFTSKDFRTWAGTLLAALELQTIGPAATQTEGRRNLAAAIERVARELGNTKAVCRKCYIHPAVLDGYLDGTLPQRFDVRSPEKGLMAFLKAREKRDARQRGPLLPLLRRSMAPARFAARGLRRAERTPSPLRSTL